MLLTELERELNSIFNPSEFNDLCHNGLMLAGMPNISKVLFAVSPTLDVIEYASSNSFSALITHHNLFTLKDNVIFVGLLGKKLKLLFDNNISLFAYHAPLDASIRFGHSVVAGATMGYELIDYIEHPKHGMIGALFNTRHNPVDNVESKLTDLYGRAPMARVYGTSSEVKTLAIVPGGGHRFIELAISMGADGFVTGTSDEPVWDLAKFFDIHFWSYGHHATEMCGMKKLADHFGALGVEVEFYDNKNIC